MSVDYSLSHIGGFSYHLKLFNYSPVKNSTRRHSPTLKRKCLHFDEIFITGCTESCQNDNFQCSQWWKFHQNDDIFVSVNVDKTTRFIEIMKETDVALDTCPRRWRSTTSNFDIFCKHYFISTFNSISRKASLYNTIRHWSGVIFTPAGDDYTWTEEITHIGPGKLSTTRSNRIYLTNNGLTNVFCWSVPS